MSTTPTVLTIPLTNLPQTFAITLNGRDLVMTSRWNDTMQTWLLDLVDGVTSLPILLSLPLVTGVDLLAQFAHLGLTGQLIVYTDGQADAPPTLSNLGIDSNLYYLVPSP
jgi:hypothetical protein